MSAIFDKVEKEARSLSAEEKAALARILIDDLDTLSDANIEQLWIEESQRRYDAYRAGDMPAEPGDEVMKRARSRLK